MKRTGISKKQERALSQAKRLALSVEGITGVDFGFVYEGGKRTRRLGLRFHVARKRPEDILPADQLIPKEIMGVACDVVQATYQPHAMNPRASFDPILPGISIGNLFRQTTGTLGAIVYDKVTGDAYILSNWHVLCGHPGPHAGEPIVQPGPQHLGSKPPRVVAQVVKSIDLSLGYDAAIAKMNVGVSVGRSILGIDLEVIGVGEHQPAMRLIKSGVSSGVTHAIIDGVEGSYVMDYSPYGDVVRWMDGIRLIPDPAKPEDEISLSGDSGALWCDPSSKLAIALHFAGEDQVGPLAEYALAHPLARTLELLDVRL
jgi:hypothetical protein